MAKRSNGSDLDRYRRDQAIHFDEMELTATREAIIEKLVEAMHDMDNQKPRALADLARDWTFGFTRHQGATLDLAAELARSVANRVLGELEAGRSAAN